MQAAFSASLLRPHAFGLTSQSLPTIQLFPTTSGYLALHQQQVIAWVVEGRCQTRQQTDHFLDVAYIKSTMSPMGNPNGFMLDSECFDTQEQAVAFVQSLVQRENGEVSA